MNILIVDDSTFSRRMLGMLISKHLEDAQLHFACDGEEGLACYQKIRPDYTFVDLLMPNMDGEEMIRHIKQLDADAGIVVVTADIQTVTREELEHYGILGFVNKPFGEEKAEQICDTLRRTYHAHHQ